MSRPSALMAQPQVISTTPAHLATGVSLTTTIDVVTNAKLLQSHISPTMPRHDSVADYKRSSIYVASSIWYDTVGGNPDYLAATGLSGTISVLNDSTIRLNLNPDQLEYENLYKVKVAHLKALVPNQNGFDTVDVQEYSFSFTMIDGPHRVVSYSIETERYLRKNDTIKVRFNRALQSTTTANGPIAEIQKHTGITAIDSASVIDNYSNVNANLSLSSDGKTLLVKPLILNSDTTYLLNVNVGYLTGDSLDNFRKDFYLKDHGTITLQVANADTTKPLPTFVKPDQGIRSWVMKVGDTLRLSAPEELSNYHFTKWVSPNLSVLNNNTNSTINYTFGFGNIDDYSITAIFAEIQKDTVEITPANPVGGKFIVQNFADSLGNGIYTFYKGTHNTMMIIAVPDSGMVFSSWISSNYPLGNSERQSHYLGMKSRTSFSMYGQRFNIGHNGFTDIVVIPPGGGGPTSGCTTHVVRIEIVGGGGLQRITPSWSRENTKFDPFMLPLNLTPISSLTPDKSDPIWTGLVEVNRRIWRLEQPDAIVQPIEITCNPGYVIQRVTLNGNILIGGENEGQAVTTFSHVLNANNTEGCTQRLEVFMRKVLRRLTVEKSGKNGVQIDPVKCIINMGGLDLGRDFNGVDYNTPENYQEMVNGQLRTFQKFVTKYIVDDGASLGAAPLTWSGGENYKGEGWLNDPGYTSGPFDANHVLSPIVMNQNRIIQYRWSADFFIEKIKLYVVDDDNGQMYPREFALSPGGIPIDERSFIKRQVSTDPVTTGYARVVFVFNRNVNASSVNGKIKASDFSSATLRPRMDGKPNKVYDNVPPEVQGNEVTFYLEAKDGSLALNMLEIKLEVLKDIESDENGNPPMLLKSNFSRNIRTAYPLVSASIESITLLKDFDWSSATEGDLRLISTVFFARYSKNAASNAETVSVDNSVDIQDHGTHTMDKNSETSLNYDIPFVVVPKSDADFFHFKFDVKDEDCGDDKDITVFNSIKNATLAGIVNAAGKINWALLAISIAAELINYSIETSCMDDNLGITSKNHTMINDVGSRYWGGNTRENPDYSLTNGPVFWKVHEKANDNFRVKYKVILSGR